MVISLKDRVLTLYFSFSSEKNTCSHYNLTLVSSSSLGRCIDNQIKMETKLRSMKEKSPVWFCCPFWWRFFTCLTCSNRNKTAFSVVFMEILYWNTWIAISSFKFLIYRLNSGTTFVPRHSPDLDSYSFKIPLDSLPSHFGSHDLHFDVD